MHTRKLFWLSIVVTLLLIAALPSQASPPNQDKGPGGVGIQSTPTGSIENEHVKALTSEGGRFIIGTTGGDPNTPNDDNKRLLYGYPSDVGSSFSTLRIIHGSTTSDYRLGSTDWSSTGIVPIAPPTSDSTTITTIWEQDGVRVEERLNFAQNSDTGRLDTTAIEYTIKNNNSSSRDAGLRIMLDTMIGGNDGAPFFVFGTGRVTQQFEYYGTNVPEYWIAYESPTFDPDSLKGRGQLSGGNATRPNRFVIADWPQAHGTVWDYTVDPNDPVTNDSAVILYYNPITLGPGQTRTVRTYYGIAKSGETAQLELIGLEVTQGIQNWENGVVLIADRPTFVRAHVRSTSGTVNDVTAELIGRRDGNELPGSPLRPANVGGSIDVLENPNRSQLNDSFYFELPESWRNGMVEFEFRGDNHTIACKEHTGTDDDCKAQVAFTESPDAEVRLVGIIWRENGTEHQPTWGNTYEVAQEIESTFPIPELDWDSPYDIEPVFFAGQPRTAWQFSRLNTMLKINRTLDGCISSWPVNCTRYYLGILVDPPSSGVWGMADGIPADVATAYLTNKFTPSHELGHAAGRRHTTCTGNEAGPDPSYPYPGGRISRDDSGDNAFYGFDINTKRIYGPNTGDLMSYCGPPRWPSDWTYTHIRDHLVSRYGTSSLSLALLAGEPAVLVSGVVTPTEETGRIASVLNIESPASVSAPNPGAYEIRFEDSVGQELASYSFEPDFGVEFCVECADNSDNHVGTFALLLPRDSRTTHIVLLYNGQVLDSRPASAHAPTATLVYPNGGELLDGPTATLQWTASDLDGDPLEYVVQYSTDAGANWQTLASAWLSTIYELNLEAIAGTTQALVRVLASDGFHTTQDQSDGTFIVAKHPPQATIQAPENNSLFVGDQTIILEGSAFDNEDGQLGDAALSWSSDLDGALGTGRSLAVTASTLTEGTHTITLTAQDSDGQTDTASITLQIYRERPTLPASLAVVPQQLSFFATLGEDPPAPQELSIRNQGDGTINWTAEADQSWILLSSTSGPTPSDIQVAVDITGLSAGSYSGQIMVSAPGVQNSPQVIGVSLEIAAPPVQVTTNPADDWRPAITRTNDGKLWVVWHSWRSDNNIWCKTSDDNGVTWSADTQLTTDPSSDYDPAIMQASDGTIWIVWYSYRSGNADIWYKTSTDGGVTWFPATQLTTDSDRDYGPAITQTSDGTVWVVWYSYRSGNADIWYKTTTDGGATWSSAVQLTAAPDYDGDPTIAQTSDDTIWVLWESRGSVWYKTSTDGGASWSADTEFSTDTSSDYDPAIAQTSDGTIWVARQSWSDPGNNDVWYKTSTDGGATWSADQRFTQFTGWDDDPGLAALPGNQVALVWQSDRAVNFDIWFGIIGVHGDVNPPPHLDSIQNYPWPNPDSNDTVTIRADVSDETGISSVILKWWVDGTSQADLTMYDDGAHDDYAADDGWYGVQIGPFPVGTIVEYQVEITDVDGNTILPPQYPMRFESLEPFVRTADILFVPDYGGSDTGWFRSYYEDALGVLGYRYDVWDTGERGEIDSATLDQYINGAIVWAVPYWGFVSGYDSTRNTLQSFLDNGGNLFITGQDIGYSIGSTSFYQDYLHASFVQDDPGLRNLEGVVGDPISDGLSFSILGGDGANNQYYPDEIDPIAPAVTILTYSAEDSPRDEGFVRPMPMNTCMVANYYIEHCDGSEGWMMDSVLYDLSQDLGDYVRAWGPIIDPGIEGGGCNYVAVQSMEVVDPDPCGLTGDSHKDVLLGGESWIPEGVQEREPFTKPGLTASGRPTQQKRPETMQVSAELQGIVGSGSGAIRVDTGTYKVVYFAFGFEGINSRLERRTVMSRVLSWFGITPPADVVQVTANTADDWLPSLAHTNDGKLWLVWFSYRSGNWDLWYKTSTDNGITWSAATQLTTDPSNDYEPGITQTSDGTLWVVWTSYRSGNGDIWYKTSIDGGATWSTDTQLTHSGTDGLPAITQASDGTLWVVWTSYRSGPNDIWYKTSTDGGVTWSADTQLTTDPGSDYDPAIMQASDGTIWVVWYSYRSGSPDLWYKTSTDGGTTWSADTQLTYDGTNGLPAITQASDGTLWVVWTSYRSGYDDIYYKISTDGGVTWSAEHQWTRFVGTDMYPGVAAMGDGSVAVAWVSDRTANLDIWFGIIGVHGDVNPPPYLDWVRHDPWPNPDSNDTTTIRAEVSDEIGVVDVILKWWVDSTSQPDLNMYDDGSHDDYAANDGVYGVQIGPFPVGTIVEYQVGITDVDGNTVLAPQYPMQFESLAPFVPTADILFVPDYGGNSTDWFRPYYTNALDDLGYGYDVWDTGLRGAPDSSTLGLYANGVVIWASPDWGYFDDWDVRPDIETYLDAGGKLFMTGQDIAQDLNGTTLLSDYLHATWIQDRTYLYALNGTTGDPIGDGLVLGISGGDGADNQYDTDEIDPISPAVTVFTYDTAALIEPVKPEVARPEREGGERGKIPLRVPWRVFPERSREPVGTKSAAGLQGIASSGAGGLRVDTGTYKVVFFSFGFEGINSQADRNEVTDRVITWLMGCSDPHEPNDTPGQATPIAYGTTLTDPDICPLGDVDYYSFTASAGDVIIADIDAEAIGSSLDSYLYLYDTDGVTELTRNDAYDGFDSRIMYLLPAGGTYYLMVRSFDHPNEGGADHFYTLSLMQGPPPFDVDAGWTSSVPTADGHISAGEWDEAAAYDISAAISSYSQKQWGLGAEALPEVLLQEREEQRMSVEPKSLSSTVTLYAMNDGTHLYLAIDNPNDTLEDAYDQMGVYFDDNPLPSDGQWTNTSCGHPDGEGNFWVLTDTVKYREWIAGPNTCDVVTPAPGTAGAVGYGSGHVQAEIAMDLTSSALRAIPGDATNIYLWIYDANSDTFDGQWPITADFRDPSTYRLLTLATGEVIISDVRTTNVRDISFTVSWLTNVEASGEVHYGTDPANLNQIAYDDRGMGASDDTHYVTLLGLSPSTTYYFDVVSGPTTDDNDGDHYSVTTGPTLGLPPSDTIYGQVFKEDKVTPALGCIVYITLRDADGSGSSGEAAPLSSLTDVGGYWYTNLGNVRVSDLSDYFGYSPSGDQLKLEVQCGSDGTGRATVDTGDDTPAPIIYLSHTVFWEIPLHIGWNHISLPLTPLTPYTAEGVCSEIISQGGDAAEVDRWYASGWDGHICGLPFNDFAIELGSDYFIKSSAVMTWTIEGYPVTTPVPLDLQVGWNSIGIPHTDAYTAQSLCDEINDQCGGGTAVEVDRWYASGWDGHICGLPFNDFDIEIGKGYFVKSASACTVTPSLAALSIGRWRMENGERKMENGEWKMENGEWKMDDSPPSVLPLPPSITGVKVTNVRDTSFTVSWTTDREATGYPSTGPSSSSGGASGHRLEFTDGRVFYDVRGKGFAGDTHYVMVTGLAPKTTYIFDVHSGATLDNNAGMHYTIATLPTLDTLPDSDAVYGQVFLTDEVTPAEGAIVYLTLADGDGQGSPGEAAVMSALVDGGGWWYANLGNARLADGSGYFAYSAVGDAVMLMAQGPAGRFVSRTVDTGDLGSAVLLTLVRQRRPYLPLVIEE